jgi:hypothetical protein
LELGALLFYFGSVFKSEDFDGPLAFINPVVDQVISMDEFQDAATLFYLGSAVRHRIKTQRQVKQARTKSVCCFRILGGSEIDDADDVFVGALGKDDRIHQSLELARALSKIPAICSRTSSIVYVFSPPSRKRIPSSMAAKISGLSSSSSADQLVVEDVPKLSFFFFCQFRQLFEDFLDAHCAA